MHLKHSKQSGLRIYIQELSAIILNSLHQVFIIKYFQYKEKLLHTLRQFIPKYFKVDFLIRMAFYYTISISYLKNWILHQIIGNYLLSRPYANFPIYPKCNTYYIFFLQKQNIVKVQTLHLAIMPFNKKSSFIFLP